MTAPQQGLQIVETRTTLADPTALGVFGLSLVTFVAASAKMHWTEGVGYLIPWTMFLGSIAQIWASSLDFKKNNYFGAIVLGVYGLFWMAVSMHWAISLGWFGAINPAQFDPKQIAFAFFGYGIFSLFIMVVAFETNKVFATIVVLINVLLFSLGFAALGVAKAQFSTAAAWSELLISLLGFYACGAIFFRNFFGREILPLGAPLGLIKRS
ncbi:acetate uptake transporter [Pseudogulbenkiania ferrooxidans]|uniref:GPR1/FUN34/YaaH family protein n=1 Tax=Pseudogulbenkiania ferrooxidans 2002 TaxID=279714 RepID=B9Z0D8_9NEIS|nr:GPR1/FUN34/YaaH family transporter [Pseudogulbenkiania ferrooxidans]EEG09544.1 GPR1/FUN34/YaaH family protein [Pseudogulbenkiania ferrooxidans 2002]